MVKSQTVSISPAQHASRHSVGGSDPLVDPLFLHATRHQVGGADPVPIIPTVTEEQASRVTDTNYQNTGVSMMIVMVSVDGVAGTYTVDAYVKATSPADTRVARSFGSTSEEGEVTFIVPAGFYYRVVTANTILHWIEAAF